MAQFTESGMVFAFPDSDCFMIEKSHFYKQKRSLSCVECLLFKGACLYWIEAKSSFPRAENREDFDKNLNDIAAKFIHSYELFASHFLGVNMMEPSETPQGFLDYKFIQKQSKKFILIINCKNIDKKDVPGMIQFIQDSFKKNFRWHRSIWNTDLIVMDHNTAIDMNFVKQCE